MGSIFKGEDFQEKAHVLVTIGINLTSVGSTVFV
jgi:hypothetical protein